jgi:hypothetical protein
VASFAGKIDDGPMLLGLLKAPKLQINGFMSAKTFGVVLSLGRAYPKGVVTPAPLLHPT